MKENITKEDVLALREELLQYAEKAEQHEFPMILLVHMKINQSIDRFDKMTIENLNAMYRVVYGIIGKDFSEYRMKTFPSYDYTLCREDECKKKDTCMRYLTYRKAQEEKYPYRLSVCCREETETECDRYVEAKEETKC